MVEQVLAERLSQSTEDSIWLNDHYEQLKQKYPNQWVACLNQQVIDRDRNFKKLRTRLARRYPERVTYMAVMFVSSKKVEMIL
jgi:hypothetical protein